MCEEMLVLLCGPGWGHVTLNPQSSLPRQEIRNTIELSNTYQIAATILLIAVVHNSHRGGPIGFKAQHVFSGNLQWISC